MDQIIIFSRCPRCEEKAFEVMKTYAHCVQCNYFTDEDKEATPIIPKWVKEAVEEQIDSLHINETEETRVA